MTPTHSSMTLDQCDALMSDKLGEPALLAVNFRRLAVIKAALTVADARSTELLAAAAERAERNGGKVRSGRWVVEAQSYTTSASWSVPAAVIKKARPHLWEQCRARQRFVTVKPPGPMEATAELWIPATPEILKDPDVIVTCRQKLVDLKRPLELERDTLAQHLYALCQRVGWDWWDGEATVTADGWQIQTAALKYAHERLKALDPELYERLAVEIPAASRVRRVVREFDPIRDEDLDDGDSDDSGMGRWG